MHITINIIRIIFNVVVVRNGKAIFSQLKGCWHDDIGLKVYASYSGSKATRILVPKVHINEKNNIVMEKNLKTKVK